jgi:hypothetical protein
MSDMVVVADAGMLSAANLNAVQDVGFSFIVGSRISKAPYDLAEHFERHGDYFADGQILESSRVMGIGKAARTWRIVYQYSFKRRRRDDRAINAMIERAEKITSGTAAMRNVRFLKVTGATKEIDQKLVNRARHIAGLKGLRHQHPPRHHDRCRGDRRVSRPVAGSSGRSGWPRPTSALGRCSIGSVTPSRPT